MYTRQTSLFIKIVALVLLFYFGWQLLMLMKNILIPVIVASLIAITLFPLQMNLENKLKWPRSVSSLVCVSVVVIFLTSFVYLIGIEASAFNADLRMLAQKFNTNNLSSLNNAGNLNSQGSIFITKVMNTMFSSLSSLAGKMLLSIMSTVVTIVLIIVFTFFFLYYRRLLYDAASLFFHGNKKTSFDNALLAVRKLTRHFMTGLLIEMVIVAILSSALMAVFGIKHSITLGVLAAVLNVIPYIGIYSATLLAVLITYSNSGSAAALSTAIILLSVHTIDANVLMPRIMGSQVKLNSLAALLSVLSGGLLWGIPGLFLAIPIAAIARIIFEQIPSLMPLAVVMGSERVEKKK